MTLGTKLTNSLLTAYLLVAASLPLRQMLLRLSCFHQCLPKLPFIHLILINLDRVVRPVVLPGTSAIFLQIRCMPRSVQDPRKRVWICRADGRQRFDYGKRDRLLVDKARQLQYVRDKQ